MLEKTLQSPLDGKEIQLVNLKENQPWIFIERTEAEAEAPILWPHDAKSRLMENTLMLGKIEGRRRSGDRGQDGWMASPTRWTWVWASSGRWWRTEKPCVLQSIGSERVRHDWASEQQYNTWSFVTGYCQLWGFPRGSEVKAPACNAGDLGSIPESGRSPEEGNSNPLQYSCLENPMDRGAWRTAVLGLQKSQTRLSD